MLETYPVLTLAPPVLAITLAVTTKRVVLSLGVGVLAAALLIAGFDPLAALRRVVSAFTGIFWADGALSSTNVYILVFTLLLGVIAAFIMMSGGTQAFADWAQQRIRTRPRATVLPAVLGAVIFIDDYFNALTVGQVSRPVTDHHRVSRAKLTYVVDSTSAPVAVLVPFSSWGAYIIGIVGPIVAASELDVSPVQAFLGAAAANFYALAAIVTVWSVLLLRLDLGRMRQEEHRALVDGDCYDRSDDVPGQLSEDLPVHRPGAMRALVVPFALLVVGVFLVIAWTGRAAAGSWDVVDVLAGTDVGLSLLVGGLLGLAGALYYYVRDTASNPTFAPSTFGRGWWEGVKSMWPAVSILLLAWMLGDLIEALGTGDYLGSLVEDSSLSPAWLVPVIFLLAAAMAFATGTSWGSFGLLLPIAGGIINSLDAPELLLPALGAVLAGAVAGDHASPISDTTILSSTGSGCNVITHVVTQLPYAALSAASAALGYVVLALTGSVALGLLTTLAVLLAAILTLRAVLSPVAPDEAAATRTPTPA